MASFADIEFDTDEFSKTDSTNNSHQNVTHSENNQNDPLRKSFLR